ncbi:CoA-acylating methylmalonate-semialdehyde dehydrogenase [Cecembia rubra]|uniref:methylmalonate-semialdehyde dehydrogenase (CoA acylating) n=1 Tax=Cecembia rubra TaxID=1485585 RepID=A0A2P8E4A8_9BACT|nr:CoA-acylating methylmalonate-semialdehyde dehydrogenase [Cecembia rubra]PSL04304.1 methylmalonate-semialdehyde dehydrogenase [acylating] [Cecembia rubra]
MIVEKQEIPKVPMIMGEKRIYKENSVNYPVFNPSTGEIIGLTPEGTAGDVDHAVGIAKKAFADWSRMPPTKRAEILFKYRALIELHMESIAEMITLENGKTIDEARGDIRRGYEVVEFACGIAHLLKGESLSNIAPEIDGITIREPLGVCAGISPFNFPAMVPMWMFPIAIACGNAFILKPSEKVPFTAIRLTELFLEAGLPPGVLNIVHGGKEVVDALCSHPGIASISFVGSSAIAKHVYRLASALGKRVQAGGGAKNVQLVMPDADPESTIRAISGAAFGCAGQRCMAGSLLVGIGGIAGSLKSKLVEVMDSLVIGDTGSGRKVDMGPVIDARSKERITDTITASEKKGVEILRDGRIGIPEKGFFVGPTLLDQVSPEIDLFEEEIFGPVLSVLSPKNLDEAISWLNQLPFGNGATIYTSNGRYAREFASKINCGMVGINVGVPAPMALFPFAGWNDSFYGDLHMQGTEGVMFYTKQRVVLSRWDNNYQRINGW